MENCAPSYAFAKPLAFWGECWFQLSGVHVREDFASKLEEVLAASSCGRILRVKEGAFPCEGTSAAFSVLGLVISEIIVEIVLLIVIVITNVSGVSTFGCHF